MITLSFAKKNKEKTCITEWKQGDFQNGKSSSPLKCDNAVIRADTSFEDALYRAFSDISIKKQTIIRIRYHRPLYI